ncbi:DUF349 domain-containing protein [Paraglaciecola sp. 2405UD69-4]|uniref:DUF349 domain-containing protein n=1 Tax=Paraglaciecola sp. 2405UD69-4 TaxID=3391836 RepID=UPI0039C92DF2
MIFKKFFQAKHLSPDPNVRIKAIENLDSKISEQKSILHELAFNDADTKVSLAALQRLDSFVLWYKMSEIAKNELVKRKSIQLVETVLLSDTDTSLTSTERRNFILEVKDSSLINKLLMQPWVQQDTKLAISLLDKIDKPLLRDKLLTNTQNEELQIAILDSLHDETSNRKLLNKFIKKASTNTVIEKAENLLSSWIKLEKIPLEVEKQVTMLLSRLLTLKDNQNLEYTEKLQEELNSEYSELAESFSHLDETKRGEIQQKYLDITNKVNRNIELLRPIWVAQQAELALQKSIETVTNSVESYVAEVKAELDSRLAEISLDELDAFKGKLTLLGTELIQLISQAPASERGLHQHLEQLNNTVNKYVHTLSHLPELQQQIASAQQLVEKLEAQALPESANQLDEAQAYLNELSQNWRSLTAQSTELFPSELVGRWHKVNKLWNKTIAEFRKELNADLTRCRNKIKAVDSLVRQGKFKAAMGLYQKVQAWFGNLNEKQQGQLQKAFTNVQEQIENLKDWQDYIAAPRKPILLKEAESLIAQPLQVDAQSAAIKRLRSQWNSLGKTLSESDQALNDAFDKALEAAFVPCREFYDKQQKERENNYQLKQQVLDTLRNLPGEDAMTVTELSKVLRTQQQVWRDIGEVDYKVRNDLYDEFRTLITPLKQKVNAFYSDNAQKKQMLVDKAKSLLELDSIHEGIEQAKVLQAKWKDIGHAGRKAEAQLWQGFRDANDRLFSKNAELIQLQRSEVKAQLEDLQQQVFVLESRLNAATNKSELKASLDGISDIQSALSELATGPRRKLENQVNNLISKQKSRLYDFSNIEKNQEYVQLFDVLRDWQEGANLPEIGELRKKWQSGFTDSSSSIDREKLTLKMEVLADKPSPDSEQAKRKQIQMELMAQKLQSGEHLELNTLLVDWIKGGELSLADKPLLERVERVFVS